MLRDYLFSNTHQYVMAFGTLLGFSFFIWVEYLLTGYYSYEKLNTWVSLAILINFCFTIELSLFIYAFKVDAIVGQKTSMIIEMFC
jgi:hypothetical protein